MAKKYIPTGVPGLDKVLNGGLIPGRVYLLAGSTGTGKTILSLQWMLDGKSHGEKCLYITLAEPGREIERNVAGFGWDLSGVEIVDLSYQDEPGQTGEYQFFSPSEVEQESAWESIYQAINEHNPQRVVIDSVTQLRYLSTDEYQFRKQVLRLVRHLNGLGCTGFFIYEPTELEKEASVALAVDGVIRLNRDLSPNRAIDLRSVAVEKIRGAGFLSGLHPLRITSQGIRVFPHIIENLAEAKLETGKLPSGIVNLDRLLGGGIEFVTSTIITGQAGVGKTSLGTMFLTQATQMGQKALFLSLEEPEKSILERSEMIGIPATKSIENGTLKIVPVNAMDLYPDELLELIREAVETEGIKAIVLDSLRGYNLAMEQFGSLIAHIQNLVNYCRKFGVTLFIINEIEHLVGELRLTELGASYLVDNVILLRYAEMDSSIVRVIGCLKKRLGHYQPELREFSISSEGIKVGEKLTQLQGILSGVPARRTPVEH